jgi:hypothetical protein
VGCPPGVHSECPDEIQLLWYKGLGEHVEVARE